MNGINKKLVGGLIGVFCICIIATAYLTFHLTSLMFVHGSVELKFDVGSIHAKVTFADRETGEVIYQYYHAGDVTNVGTNFTLLKQWGDSWYNLTQYNLNLTYISIGNGSVSTSSTVLPNEWNRTLATVQNQTVNSVNLTCTFYPDSGPYWADCIGINFEAGIGKDRTLWGYDTWTPTTTGIDDSFTITVDFKVSVT